jgi:broad specificity phosphatase PhoE
VRREHKSDSKDHQIQRPFHPDYQIPGTKPTLRASLGRQYLPATKCHQAFMKLFLIRHAETEHNIAGLLYALPPTLASSLLTRLSAGVTDSALTNHGVLQTQRLGRYLVDRHRFTQIFSSDLRRAYITAKAIEDVQKSKYPDGMDVSVVQLDHLREQDFGSFECVPWSSKRSDLTADKLPEPEDAGFKPKETSDAMVKRAEVFLEDYILPQLVIDEEQEGIVAVISHGLMLAVLWKSLLARFGPDTVSLGPEINGKAGSRPLEYLPGWSNTGYVELDMMRNPEPDEVSTEDSLETVNERGSTKLFGWKMIVRSVNSKVHLSNLNRTRGGVGSSTYDARQKNLEGYFKKPKVAAQD